MQTFSRRQFLSRTAAGAAAAGLLGADPLGLAPGFQIYPVRQMAAQDFEGTIKRIAGIGYRVIEMCSPQGYGRDFENIAKMSAQDVRKVIDGAGLRCESCHYQFKELKENLEERIAYAKVLGMKQMVLASFSMRRDAKMDDWKRAAEELNKAGEQTRKAGIQLAFHNHNGEFEKIDGVLIYDELMRALDPKLVKMQFQVAVISIGYEAVPYFEKYPGRFISLHLADWSPSDKKLTAVGKGVVDWKKLFAAAKKAGVKNYFVEVPLDAMEASYPYLHSLKV